MTAEAAPTPSTRNAAGPDELQEDVGPCPRDTSIAAVIVNWCSLEKTLSCVQNFLNFGWPNLRVVVVDNASVDGSGVGLERFFRTEPRVVVVRNAGNSGFGAGANAGIAVASEVGAEFILLMNPDAHLRGAEMRRLVEVIRADPRIGAVGPTVVYAKFPNRIWHGEGWFSRLRAGVVVPYKNRPLSEVIRSKVREVGFLTACVLLLRAEALRRVGEFDTRFFLYEEDVDLCLRLRNSRYRLLYVPDAVAFHDIEMTERYTAPVMFHRARSRLLLLRKHFSSAYVAYGLCIHLAVYGFWAALHLLRYRKDLRLLLSWWKGTIEGLTSS